MKPKDFISMIKEDAIKLQQETGIPAAVKIAQAALETGWGRWMPVDIHTGAKSYNLFGIKHHGTDEYGYVECETYEYIKGERVKVVAKFRKYPSYLESLRDHSKFLLTNARYKPAFAYTQNPEQFARELQKAGYATDPDYAKKLISIMRTYGLLQMPV